MYSFPQLRRRRRRQRGYGLVKDVVSFFLAPPLLAVKFFIDLAPLLLPNLAPVLA
jgi:hypothetical protein